MAFLCIDGVHSSLTSHCEQLPARVATSQQQLPEFMTVARCSTHALSYCEALPCWLQERFEGILQAMDTLAAEEEEPPSPHHPSEVSAGAGKGGGEEDTDQLTKEALSTMQPGDIMPRPVRRDIRGLGEQAGL